MHYGHTTAYQYMQGLAAMQQGYSSGEPTKRINPLHIAGMLGMLGLVGTTIKVAADLIQRK
jgi:hypothetical protein